MKETLASMHPQNPDTDNIPALRFPGFNGVWEKKKLGDLLEFKNGINASKGQYGRGVKFINVLDILNNEFITHDMIVGSVDIEKEKVKKYLVSFGDILFQRSSETREEVGSASVYLDKEHTATFGGFVIRGQKIGEYEPVFFNKLLKTNAAREAITSKSGGSTRFNIGQEILSSIQLAFPSLPEQTRIASFFTVLDKKLTQLKQKKSLLEQYKKGVMQRIFCLNHDAQNSLNHDSLDYDDEHDYEDKNLGNQKSGQSGKSQKSRFRQLRFKDDNGMEFPKWEKKKLGEVAYKVDKKNKKREILPVYSINNVQGFIPQSEQFEGMDSNERGYDISLYKIIEDYTFAYNPARINVGSIGFSGTIGRVIVSSLYVCFKTMDCVNDLFLNYFFSTSHFRNSVLRNGEGGVRIYLFFENFSEIELQLPSIEEQTKIANFLSAIDQKINQTETQFQQIQEWKKGLLQKMFV